MKSKHTLRGWSLYHLDIVAKQTFSYVDNQIWKMLWKWFCRRHAHKKTMMWIKELYFMRYQGQDWTFFARNQLGNIETIFKASSIKIERHPKIKSTVHPYELKDEQYFESRIENNMLNKLAEKRMVCYLYDRQKGDCPICQLKITAQTGWNAHHLHQKHLGGKWRAENFVLLHPVCHIQVHQNPEVAAALANSLKSV